MFMKIHCFDGVLSISTNFDHNFMKRTVILFSTLVSSGLIKRG